MFCEVVKRLLHEPLFHFLLIGAALFGLYHYLQPGDAAAPAKQIQLSPADLSQLSALFQAQWKRDPTPKELDSMVEEKVRSEVLYREALAMGLDKEDEIIKRRLAQKMQFLSEEIATAREPSDMELKIWFTNNLQRFTATAGAAPRFEDIAGEVKTAWLADQKAAAWNKSYQDMRAKYTVLLPDLVPTNSDSGTKPQPDPSAKKR